MDSPRPRPTTEIPRTGDTVLVTRVLPDGTIHRFRGTLDRTAPPGGFSVTGEDLGTGLRTRGYFTAEDTSPGTQQYVEKVPAPVG
ncbi:hypothetical protein [Streptomyces sp. NPDC096105]|uniref:hypothetical protein n=1 Tax=Streptomyces sp. NPDC096105 TaxID=3366074 RepID=UPI0038052DFF